jgi:GNAT superfamily N-acetyltransferase
MSHQHDITIHPADILSPAAQSLIQSLNAELLATYPEPGACHFRLDPNEVAPGNGVFLIASRQSTPIACGAIRRIDNTTAEVKRMYVVPEHRGQGVGKALLTALEQHAKSLNLTRLALETGTRQTQALALYHNAGFQIILPFAEYTTSPLSICMAKQL